MANSEVNNILTSIPMPVIVKSGLHVVGDFEIASGVISIGEVTTNISGQPVTISGQHVYVESGLGVQVQSGIHVVSQVDVASGLHVMISGQHVYVESGTSVAQSKEIQLQNYFVSDIDESVEGIKFYGYLDGDGSWYIMQDTSGTTYRYASSGIYASNWIDRSGIIYQTFDQEF